MQFQREMCYPPEENTRLQRIYDSTSNPCDAATKKRIEKLILADPLHEFSDEELELLRQHKVCRSRCMLCCFHWMLCCCDLIQCCYHCITTRLASHRCLACRSNSKTTRRPCPSAFAPLTGAPTRPSTMFLTCSAPGLLSNPSRAWRSLMLVRSRVVVVFLPSLTPSNPIARL